MALPKSYLVASKNLEGILDAMKTARAPEKFTVRFLENLGYKSTNDRLVIGVLKALGMLTEDGKPVDRYFRFLDQTQSAIVLAEGIEEAYADLFRIDINAQDLEQSVVVSKFRTLSQGQYSEAVVSNMARTFVALCNLADFKSKPADDLEEQDVEPNSDDKIDEGAGEEIVLDESEKSTPSLSRKGAGLGSMQYHINLILPDTRDPAVYDALFRSLKEHLDL